jgi:hypothetical protein
MSSIVKRNSGGQANSLPAGRYAATIEQFTDLGEVETPYGVKQQFLLVWKVSHNGNVVHIKQWVNASLHPDSTLSKIIEAVTGEEPAEEFDAAHLAGGSAMIKVAPSDAGWPRIKDVGFGGTKGGVPSAKAGNDHGLEITDQDIPF